MHNKFIIFSDFDGTITKSDILDGVITDVYSYDKYKEMENKLLTGNLSYEKYLFDMFDNIDYSLTNISSELVDEHFYTFYNWTLEHNIEFFIISSGFKKIIEFLLPCVKSNFIFANDIVTNEGNKWNVKLYDSDNKLSINKNDVIKSNSKLNYKTIFIGDGLSDFKVMGNVDYLFCKKDSLLHTKCINENCEHIVYTNFSDVLFHVKNLFL
jgi:2-hydroxy-3-keto-5-methylthiopentenyl-1-phosphate phosphatase